MLNSPVELLAQFPVFGVFLAHQGGQCCAVTGSRMAAHVVFHFLVDYKSAIVFMGVLTGVRLWSFCSCPSASIRKAKQQIINT
jgi:hypothetical protein